MDAKRRLFSSLRRGAELELNRITALKKHLSSYQNDLQHILSKAVTPEDRFRAISLILQVNLEDMKRKAKTVETLMKDSTHQVR